MTIEAIQYGTDILVTRRTELAGRIDRHITALAILAHMAVDTADQAMVGLADTLAYCLIALMLNQFEMAAPHERRGCDTGLESVGLRGARHASFGTGDTTEAAAGQGQSTGKA